MFGKKGFTLVEVLIVVIIIAILAAIGIPQYAKTIEKARGGEARAGLANIQSAEKIYYAEEETYTVMLADLDITLPQIGWDFTIAAGSTASIATSFTATATRSGGRWVNKTLTVNDSGTLGGDWDPDVAP